MLEVLEDGGVAAEELELALFAVAALGVEFEAAEVGGFTETTWMDWPD